MMPNPQLSAIALLVRKFGTKIPGGGFEVEVSHLEMKEMSPHGMFQELPNADTSTVKWQYFPNHTIDAAASSLTLEHTHDFVPPANDDEQQCDTDCRENWHRCTVCGKSRSEVKASNG